MGKKLAFTLELHPIFLSGNLKGEKITWQIYVNIGRL
jgi:hypothetical protein